MTSRKNEIIENVKVYIRVRPLKENESQGNPNRSIGINEEENSLYLNNKQHKKFEKYFKFHKVFTENSSQLEIYRTVAVPIVDAVLRGYNGTIFAYGQTGSGKTHTMVGEIGSENLQGIIPNSFSQIFSLMTDSIKQKSFVVTATFLEIYNEEINDLLCPNREKKYTIHDHKNYGCFVKNLSGFTVNSVEELRKLFVKGNKNRTTKSNALNINSSRSHAIFTVMIESKNRETDVTTFGKLNFVDLAGSERLTRTRVSGDMLREASHINLSLSVLGNVISSLADGKTSHIAYRNSKLTRLLQDSLGGNSKTTMIATLSQAESDYDESLCTLRYASRVRYIKNYVTPNSKTDGLIECFEKQIEELQNRVLNIQEAQERREREQEKKLVENKKLQEELDSTDQLKQRLMKKIEILQQKIIVGGVNLLDKVEEQNCLLLQSSNELVELHERNKMLEEILSNHNVERTELNRNFSSLREENKALDEQIEMAQEELKRLRDEQEMQKSEQQFEMERRLDESRSLSQDLNLQDLVLQSWIPQKFQKIINSCVFYDTDSGEFRLKYVAHAGNNILRRFKTDDKFRKLMPRHIKSPYILSNEK